MAENKQLTKQEKNITDSVLSRIEECKGEGTISFPSNYNYANALKSAQLILAETVDRNKQPVLQTCSKASICNALLDMTLQGLSPAKKQCYFVAFNGKLQLMKSYLGNIAATKRLKGVKDVFANVIYEGDNFEYKLNLETGLIEIVKHEQKFENIGKKILGAYAVVVRENAPNYVEVMNMEQIKNAWNMGAAKGKSGAHQNFGEEMAKKTVINRACKRFVNTSDDSDVLIESINRTNEYREEDIIETTQAEVKEEIKENANSIPLDLNEDTQATQVKEDEIQDAEFVEAEVVENEDENPPF
ncbi:recombinational DNA repair protein (RecE pathway) [Clostridium perfringens]|uniref:Recombinational DNA repair protein (RecE pathway) n=3 Tax=Clostridium perfringens TaxID=1502 RepID=A0A2X3IRR1_CLOPF|nr:RecT family recombinase [Clostridium perfringens]SQC85435.1 recombinational DNA repair protein (RecE pathway) [Clostridium perfringens]